MTKTLVLVAALLVPTSLVTAAAAGPPPAKVAANHVAEVEFVTALKRPDPFNEVSLDVLFTEPGGRELRVPAFWAGGRVWKVRYASAAVGEHRFRTESSDDRDSGLHGITGSVTVEPYAGDHPLYKRGPLRVAENKQYLEHADGTPFLWLGDTWWMGLTKRLSFPDEFNTLLADRKKKGFNVVQIVAGLYPDMPAFDERGANEAGFPWEKDYSRIRPEYFDQADRRIMRLVEEGVTPCVVGAWGYHLPWLGPERMKQHQRYLYARWGALPIIWCVAGETNLPYYLEPGFPHKGGDELAAKWADVVGYCRSINAFDRLITSHPTGIAPMSMRGVFKDAGQLLDFDMLQTAHGQLDVIPQTVTAVRFSHSQQPPMPVVNGEPSYEMLMDKTPAENARMVFWMCWANGVKGYTYGANGIWQLNGRDKPYGNSPWGGSYGKISWQDAMNLAGSAQVALGTKFLSQYPWHRFTPQPGWAAWADEPWRDVPVGEWIWFPEGEPAKDAPIGARFFRRTFQLPADAKVNRAVLRIAADDRCTVWLNGEEIGASGDWHNLASFEQIGGKLRPGRNVLAVRAENVKSDVTHNPAGMVAGMVAELEGGKQVEIPTGADWRVSKDERAGWQAVEFDDKAWVEPKSAALFGGAPWGRVPSSTDVAFEYLVPHAMGVSKEVRVIYVPKPGDVKVSQLEPDVTYRASHFDPVTGGRKELGEVKRDKDGTWRCESPATAHDWVLLLEAAPR